MSAPLPMFPLGTVLVPHGFLPLHVFEPRYRVLMFDCLRGDREFGVVLIERGSEVGGDDQRFRLGTVARIVDADELPDGRWSVLAVGTRRIDVVEWLPDDPYPRAMVEERPEGAWPVPAPAAGPSAEADAEDPASTLAAAGRAVQHALSLAAELGAEVPPAGPGVAPDPAVAAWQLLAMAPITSLDKHRLLAVDDPIERLQLLATRAEEQATLLAYRLNRE